MLAEVTMAFFSREMLWKRMAVNASFSSELIHAVGRSKFDPPETEYT
jgi:hypothetical protein